MDCIKGNNIGLKPKRLFFYNLLMTFIPETSCFALKRGLLRWCGATIGKNVRICSSARFYGTGEFEIGEETWIGHHSLMIVSARVFIGAYVDIAPWVYIGTGSHEIDREGLHSAGKGISQPVIIEDGCWLGARAMVLPGVTIKHKAVVGAGALVTKDVAARTVALGAPAREVRKI